MGNQREPAPGGHQARREALEAMIEREAVDIITDLLDPSVAPSATTCRVVEDHLRQLLRNAALARTQEAQRGEASWIRVVQPDEDTFAEMGEAAEGAILSEEGWSNIGRAAWAVLARDAEVTDWSGAERGKFAAPAGGAAR